MTQRAAISYEDIRGAHARIRDRIRLTPMVAKEALTATYGVSVHLKFEHLQRTGSFKIRGALNLVSQLSTEERQRGLVAASAGNHAQGVAVAGAEFGAPTTIFMPTDASLSKIEATRGYGAQVELVGDNLIASIDAAQARARETGAVWVHPYDDPRVIAGQGTVGVEIVEQRLDVDTVLVAVGGGGLCAGVATAVKHLRPECRVVAVQSAACAPLKESLARGEVVAVDPSPTLADGIAVKQLGSLTFPILRDLVDEVVVVDDDEIAAAMLWLIERGKQVVEGAGAAPLAALQSGRLEHDGPVVAVMGGGNIDPMNIMPVIRHGLTTLGRFLRIGLTLPDSPGELSKVLARLASLRVNVMGVEHRREAEPIHVGDVRVYLTLQTRNRDHVDEVVAALSTDGYAVDR